MTNDLLVKIDTLIEMSKSTSNYDTLKAELIEIQADIDLKKKEMEDLRLSIKDEKYIKASDRIIDENIKVSLELKIQKLEANLKKSEKELKKILKEEETSHQTMLTWEEKVSKLTKLLSVLNEKLNSLNKSDKETREYYQNLISETEKKLESAELQVTETKEEYLSVSRKLTDFTNDVTKLKTSIQEEKEKLSKTIESLLNNESYIDQNKKNEDEKRLNHLRTKIEELQTRKEEILKDPSLIGNEAKELLIEDDRTGCLAKVRELVTIVKKLPFMELDNSSEVNKILKEALETASLERDEYASYIESKQYNGNDTKIVKDRQKYLEEQKQELEEELTELKNKIKQIDTVKVKEINSLLSAATVIEETLKKELNEYKIVIEEEKENESPKKKAVLLASYKKKEEELAIIEEMISAYENEMEDLMLYSKELEIESIGKINEKINKIEKSLKDVAKKVMVSGRATDVLAVESDKNKLKELNDKINAINERKKYKETPSEIYDEIEMALGAFLEEESKNIIEDPNDFRITEDLTPSIEDFTRVEKNKNVIEEKENLEERINIDWDDDIKVSEEAPIVMTEVENPTPEIISNPIIEETITPLEEIKPMDFSILDSVQIPVTERLKVINIEDLENQTEEPKEIENQSDVMISDFKDDDYIDFDSIIGG